MLLQIIAKAMDRKRPRAQAPPRAGWRRLAPLAAALLVAAAWAALPETAAAQEAARQAAQAASSMPWWGWPLILFVVTFVLGILAVLGGVGGGVLFVPIIGGFFPFHMDFVRGAGLLVALSGALAAGPGLLLRNLASLRLALPTALIASASAIVGAMIGLALPQDVIQIALGATILLIVAIMLLAKRSELPEVKQADNLCRMLGITGQCYEESERQVLEWKTHRTALAFFLFIIIGIMAGMFGLGAGWANVPVLNMVMGVPIKIAVGTSKFLLSITDTSAAWVYLNNGAALPMIVVPSVLGIMLGSFIGVRLLAVSKPKVVRWIVIVMLLFAGARSVLKGFGI